VHHGYAPLLLSALTVGEPGAETQEAKRCCQRRYEHPGRGAVGHGHELPPCEHRYDGNMTHDIAQAIREDRAQRDRTGAASVGQTAASARTAGPVMQATGSRPAAGHDSFTLDYRSGAAPGTVTPPRVRACLAPGWYFSST
jgi:hypothetical protein